jgi:hypothetical protein
MKKNIFIRDCLLSVILLNVAFGTDPNQYNEYDLELNISCPVKSIPLGEKIPVTFTITNRDKRDYEYEKRSYDRSGRMYEYQLQARDKNGKILADPRENIQYGLGGGLSSGMGKISTGQSFNFTVALNRWALINTAGKYTVTGIYNYSIPKDPNTYPKAGIIFEQTIKVKSKPIEIDVLSRSRGETGKYIEELQGQLKATKSSTEREEILKNLIYTCDERIIPTLVELLYSSKENNDIFWAVEGLICYLPKTANTKNQLIKIAQKRGLGKGMYQVLEAFNCDESTFKEIIKKSLDSQNIDIVSEAAIAAQKYLSDDIMPGLIAVAKGTKNPGSNINEQKTACQRALYAIAFNRTDEGVEALRFLLNNTDIDIRNATAAAIRQAYRRPTYPKKSDEEYTTALIPIAADPNHPRQLFCVYELLNTRTEEAIAAIKGLLENPQVNLPIAEKDSGVKTIKNLLRSPDKEYRKMIADFVKSVYKVFPGRPLRDDDFPESFQQNSEEHKKKVLEQIQSWQN